MNRVYKVVFNKATGVFVAVAECAKGQGKKNTVKKSVNKEVIKFSLTALSAGCLLVNGQAFAATGSAPNITTGTTSSFTSTSPTNATSVSLANGGTANANLCYFGLDSKSIICGDATTSSTTPTGAASPTLYTVTLGPGATTIAPHAVAIGNGATSNTFESIAIGKNAKVDTTNTVGLGGAGIAIGSTAQTAGTSSIAIGTGASTYGGNGGVALGSKTRATSEASTALGGESIAGNYATAVGSRANASDLHGVAVGTVTMARTKSTAVGPYAASEANFGVSLGSDTIITPTATGSTALGSGTVVSGTSSGGISTTSSQLPTDFDLTTGDRGVTRRSVIGGDNNFAIGNRNVVGSKTTSSVVMGNDIKLGADSATLQTNNFTTLDANYRSTRADTVNFTNEKIINRAVAIGQSVKADANSTIVIGDSAKSLTDSSIAMGKNAVAGVLGSTVANNAVAIGTGAQATGSQSISIGTGNVVTGNKSGAIGDPTTLTGTGTYTLGNDNGTVSANNAGVFGNNNTLTGDNSRIVGNNNIVTNTDTFVLGNNVTNTIANSVALGSNSAMTAGAAVGTANLTSTGTQGTTTTAGDKGTVSNATVGGITYGNFAGATANGVVSVGAAGSERRIQNVAAGEISATSTDAVNGSQLYAVVANQTASPLTFTANTNADTGADGTQQKLGSTLKIIGSTNAQNLSADTSGTSTAGTYSAKNIQTVVTDGQIQVQMAENPVFNNINATSLTTGNTLINNTGVTLVNGAAGQPVSLTASGLNNGGNIISNVASGGTMGSNAANINDVNAAKTTVKSSNNSISVVDTNNGTGNLAYDIQINNQAVVNNAQLPIVYTDVNGNKVFKQPDGTFRDSYGNIIDPATIITSLQNANGSTTVSTKLANVAPATLSSTSTEAVNGSQLYTTNQNVANNTSNIATNTAAIAKGINFGGTTGSNNYQLGDTINVKGDSNITSTTIAGGTQFALAPVVNIGTTSPVTINGNTGTINGLTNTTFNSAAYTSGQAATEDQLAQVAQQANQKGSFNLTAQGNNASTVENGSTVDLRNTDGNIVVNKNTTDNSVNFNLAKNIAVDSVKVGDTMVDSTGITINNGAAGQPVTLTSTGLNNGGNVISNVASGGNIATNAANIGDIQRIQEENDKTSSVTTGDGLITSTTINGNNTNYNIDLAQTTKDDIAKGVAAKDIVDNQGLTFVADAGATTSQKLGSNVAITGDNNITTKAEANGVQVTLNKDITVDSVKVADGVSIDNNGINVANKQISNVAAGTNPNDAVNVSQLNAAKTEVKAGKNIVVDTIQGSDGQTIYTVNATAAGISVNGGTATSNNIVNGQGTTVKTTATGDIQIDTPLSYVNSNLANSSVPTNDVALVGANQNSPVQLHNLADGVAPNDAVNVSQLNRLGYKLGNQIDDVEDNANAGTSAAMATAALPQAYLPGKSMLAGGMATYNGQSAAAIGVSKLSDNGRWVIKVNGTADTQGNFGGAVGAGFHW